MRIKKYKQFPHWYFKLPSLKLLLLYASMLSLGVFGSAVVVPKYSTCVVLLLCGAREFRKLPNPYETYPPTFCFVVLHHVYGQKPDNHLPTAVVLRNAKFRSVRNFHWHCLSRFTCSAITWVYVNRLKLGDEREIGDLEQKPRFHTRKLTRSTLEES